MYFFMQTANIQNTASVDKSHLRKVGDYLLLSFSSVFLKLHRVKSVRELPTGPPPRYESHLLQRRVAGWDSSALKLRNVFIPPHSPPQKRPRGMQGQVHKRLHGGERLQRSLRCSILPPPTQPPPPLESNSDPGRAGTGDSQVGRKREGRAAKGEARSRNE